MAHAVSDSRAAARTATEVAGVSTRRPLHGVAQEHATAMLAVAMTTLDRLSDLGWRAVVGDPPRAIRRREGRATWAIGGDAVAERTESFDALGAFDKD
jgi:hypothetical protein